jgi:FkbM family methyltransferase
MNRIITESDFEKLLLNNKNRYIEKTNNFYARERVLIVSDKKEDILDFKKCTDSEPSEIITLLNDDELTSLLKKNKRKSVFIHTHALTKRVYNKMAPHGIIPDNVYVGPNSHGYIDLYEKRNVIYSNIEKICKVYNLLYDNQSKQIYLDCMTRLIAPYQFHYPYIESRIQYFHDAFTFSNKEVFIDAGMYDGRDTINFLEKVNHKYSAVYGFEADPENYMQTKDNLSQYSNIILYNAALGCHDGNCRFLSSYSSTKRSNPHVGNDGDITVASMSGDNLLVPATFIKMDIEGSEIDALKGLRKTISMHKPKLAICIYHWQSDFWNIPLLIHEFNPAYKIAIYNHSNMSNLLETVCYAW